jgi:phosphopantothenoylcysteine decarboxylase
MTNRELLIGVTGGVAAYKTAALVSDLVQRGAGVTVVMSHGAGRFIGPATFEALTGRRVYQEVFDPEHPLGPHIVLAERAELFCVAPATAHFLAKAACGLADDLLSTLYLAFRGPVIIAPAMNNEMWEQPAVQRNCRQLQADGVRLVGPEEGWLSCRRRGMGRMANPATIAEAVAEHLAQVEPRR